MSKSPLNRIILSLIPGYEGRNQALLNVVHRALNFGCATLRTMMRFHNNALNFILDASLIE